jgi:hypothetical protein
VSEHNPPKTITLRYNAYADFDLQEALDEAEIDFDRKDIKEIAVKWDDVYITTRDGREATLTISLLPKVQCVKRPELMIVENEDYSATAEADGSYVDLEDPRSHTHREAINMFKGYLEAYPSERFKVVDGRFYDNGKEVILIKANLAFFMGLIAGRN